MANGDEDVGEEDKDGEDGDEVKEVEEERNDVMAADIDGARRRSSFEAEGALEAVVVVVVVSPELFFAVVVLAGGSLAGSVTITGAGADSADEVSSDLFLALSLLRSNSRCSICLTFSAICCNRWLDAFLFLIAMA